MSNELTNGTKSTIRISRKLNRIIRLFNKYRGIATFLGVIVSSLWVFVCNIYYYGYASKLGVDISYISKDNTSLLINVLVFVFSFVYCILYICRMSEQLDNNGTDYKAIKKSIVKSLIPLSLSILFLASYVMLVFIGALDFIAKIEVMFSLFCGLSLCQTVTFFIQLAVTPIEKKMNKKQESNSSSDNTNIEMDSLLKDDNDPKNKKENNRSTSILISVALTVFIIIIVISFLIGWFNASNQREFNFIVTNFECTDITSDEVQYNLILSENDDYYCLSAYTVNKINGVNKITIYSNYQTITNKSKVEETKITKREFDKSEISNDTPPFKDFQCGIMSQ